MDASEFLCPLYFENQVPCLGGTLALDGQTGETLWTHWTAHAIFSTDCGIDLTNDKINDCIISGHGGILQAINGRDGLSLWEIPIQTLQTLEQPKILDIYDAKYVPDVDGDNIGDVLASHTLQAGNARTSEIVIVSGKTGNIIQSIALPSTEQLFAAPQALIHPDGETMYIIATSSDQQSGGLYLAPQSNLIQGELKLRQLHHGAKKGVLLPPVLADITSDGTEDIVAAILNATIVAYDGRSFEQIWNYTVPNSEVISIPIPGYYNDDDVPDFMVKHQIGPGFPTYYYTIATVLDGKTGEPLLEKPFEDSLSGQMSGLSITVDGYGNDWFLHWSADCLNHEGGKNKYQFLKSETLISQTRADICKLRFNSTLTTKLLALSQHVGPSGISLYSSEDWKRVEFNNSIDPRKEAEEYLEKNPEFSGIITDTGIPSASERSPKNKNDQKANSLQNNSERDLFAERNKYYSDQEIENAASAIYKDPENFKDREVPDINLDSKISDNFNTDEEWSAPDKWDKDNIPIDREYDTLYEDGDDRGIDPSQINEIREQRSDKGEMKRVNNNTNEYKNQLDPSMDYTNGQTRYNYYNTQEVNKTKSENDSAKDAIFSNIDIEYKDAQSRRTSKKRNKAVLLRGQKEVISSELQSNPKSNQFIKLEKRMKKIVETKKAALSSSSDENVDLKRRLARTVMRNVQLNDDIEIHPISETLLENISHNAIRNTREERRININDVPRNSINDSERIGKVKNKWLLENNFAKPIQNDEDANIEKIFKRESMKNHYQRNADKRSFDKDGHRIRSRNVQYTNRKENQMNDDDFNKIDGVQKQPPTGILLPSGSPSSGTTSIDLVFSTYWLPPSEATIVLLQQDLDCISGKKSKISHKIQREENDKIVQECLTERGVNYNLYQEARDRENVKIALGQMTVYRMRLKCVCPEDMLPGQSCKNISRQQSWPAHLGASGNGYFKPLKRPST
ncbi:uncharacterized protein LOC105698194 isoform X1 [Orussus abietinus]|nr:uncharacterized protein LOC105698194 isoform X1 [Orussus abietinus]XP_012277653.1 uncharacterized protein LOC105698194 isoform X1 [Orussus abietinus]XP_012277654.1 uncharacterized protein LOC105698194 isoform X1 [Orussus abietinus]